MKVAILTHGGAASPASHSDGCKIAAEAGRAELERTDNALLAAIAATVILENDVRFNAGTGSNLRLDGKTIEMDASVMTSEARFGAVACIQRVKNPILVAAKVMETPHLLLVGDGATAFARRLGFDDYDPTTDRAREKYAKAIGELRGDGDGSFALDAAPWQKAEGERSLVERLWNFDGEPPVSAAPKPVARPRKRGGPSGRGDTTSEGCDTVGAVVRDAHGRFAATASTGGTVYMLKGRVGDSPLMGCGIFAGPHGAVAATGVGEEIVRRFLSKTVYDALAEGIAPARAARRGLALFPDVVDVGLLVIGRRGQAIASNRNMASAELVG